MQALRSSHEYLMYQAALMLNSHEFCDDRSVSQPVIAAPRASQQKRIFKMSWQARMQRHVNKGIKGNRSRSIDRLEIVFGYKMSDLRLHLERQFTKKMTWDNYAGNLEFRSNAGWVVDHIVAKYLFKRCEAREAFSLSNLRPLWIQDNLRKGIIRTHLI